MLLPFYPPPPHLQFVFNFFSHYPPLCHLNYISRLFYAQHMHVILEENNEDRCFSLPVPILVICIYLFPFFSHCNRSNALLSVLASAIHLR